MNQNLKNGSELSLAKKQRRLPKVTPTSGIIDGEEINTEIYKLFVVTDMTYQLLFDSFKKMQMAGGDLRPDIQYRFNKLVSLINETNNSALKVSENLSAMKEEDMDYFFRTAEGLAKIVSSAITKAEKGYDLNVVAGKINKMR